MDYARSLVEHPMWRWEPGMVAQHEYGGEPEVIQRIQDGRIHTASIRGPWMRYNVAHPRLRPAINHPATKGWLLHMLREAVEGHAFCDLESTEPDEWRVNADYLEMDGPWDFPTAPTEGEALAAALLAVWGQAA